MPRLTLDLPAWAEPQRGDVAASTAGAVYRIATAREVRRRTRTAPGRRWALIVERVDGWQERADVVAEADAAGVAVWEFTWYPRGRR